MDGGLSNWIASFAAVIASFLKLIAPLRPLYARVPVYLRHSPLIASVYAAYAYVQR